MINFNPEAINSQLVLNLNLPPNLHHSHSNSDSYHKKLNGVLSEFDFQFFVRLAIHELTHAFGFANYLYQDYFDSATGLVHY